MNLDGETMDALGYQQVDLWAAQLWAHCDHRRQTNAKREAVRAVRQRPSRAVAVALTAGQKRSIDFWLRRGKPISEIARKVGVSRNVVLGRRPS
jgi:hypothetical protein